MLMVVELWPLRATLTLDGLAERLKSGEVPAVTVRLTDVVRVPGEPVPDTVRFVVPSAAVLLAVNVSDALPPVVDVGLNVAVTPLGRPATGLKATLPVNPPVRVMLIVVEPCPLRATPRLEGFAARLKSGDEAPMGFTTTSSKDADVPYAATAMRPDDIAESFAESWSAPLTNTLSAVPLRSSRTVYQVPVVTVNALSASVVDELPTNLRRRSTLSFCSAT